MSNGSCLLMARSRFTNDLAGFCTKAQRLKEKQRHKAKLEDQQPRQEEVRRSQEELLPTEVEQGAANWTKTQQLRAYVATYKEYRSPGMVSSARQSSGTMASLGLPIYAARPVPDKRIKMRHIFSL